MQQIRLPLLFGIFGASLAGSVIFHALEPSPRAVASPPTVLKPEVATPANASLEAVQDQLGVILRRLETLEASSALLARQPVMVTDLLGEEAQIEAAVAAVLADRSSGSGAVRNLISDTLASIRTQEETDRELVRDQRRLDAVQRRIDRLTEDLALLPNQATQLYNALISEDSQRNDLRDSMREGTVDLDTFRDGMRDLQADTKASIANFLTAEQIEQYNEANQGSNRRQRTGGNRNP